MRSHVDILGKKPREQWVFVMTSETEDADVVRVRFREIPSAEFDTLETQLQAALSSLSRVLRRIDDNDAALYTARLAGVSTDALVKDRKALLLAYKEVHEDLLLVRREIVGKVVIDHQAEYFTLDHLPLPSDDLAAEVEQSLLGLGLSADIIAEGFKQGFIQVPFLAQSWAYGDGATAKQLPGAHPDTVRYYERCQPGQTFLHSLCNAVLYWHRLALKPPEAIKEAMRTARLTRKRQADKIEVLRSGGLLRDNRVKDLQALSNQNFELVSDLLLECLDLVTASAKDAPKEPPENPLQG